MMLTMISETSSANAVSAIEYDSDICVPDSIGTDSYLVIGSADTERSYDIFYNDTNDVSVEYNSAISHSFNSYQIDTLSPGDVLSQDLKVSSRRNTYNPFLDPLGDPLPKILKFNSTEIELSATQQRPISLHTNYTYTFTAERGTKYDGICNLSSPFYLDIEIHAIYQTLTHTNPVGSLNFSNANPRGVTLRNAKNTIPIFPDGQITRFTFSLDTYTGPISSLVSLTLHPLKTFNVSDSNDYVSFEDVEKSVIAVNSTFTGIITQGVLNEEETFDPSCADIFSVRYFSLTIEKDNEYMIAVDSVFQLQVTGNLTSTGLIPFLHEEGLIDSAYKVIAGSFSDGSVSIKARKSDNLILALCAYGIMRAEYTISFNQVVTDSTESLTLNTPIQLDSDVLYQFTLEQDSMMAINYSGNSQEVHHYKDVDFEWESVVVSGPVSGFLTHVLGIIYNDTIQLTQHWYYIPVGTYAVSVDTASGIDDYIQFNVIAVQTFSDELTINVNQNSLIALQLPLTYHRFNNYSFSVFDHINQSILYECAIVGKYNEITTPNYFTRQLGNVQSGSAWEAWGLNYTQILQFVPARTNEIPIIILRPVHATQNVTNPSDFTDTFAANITIRYTVPNNYYPYTAPSGLNIYGVGGGDIIPFSDPVIDIGEFSIDEQFSTSGTHIYIIPLSVDADSVYNITVFLIGNNSMGHNATFDGMTVVSGNMASVEIFGSETDHMNDTHLWKSQWILTLAGNHYLYVDLDRAGFRNATMIVKLDKIPISKMSFDIPELETYPWNQVIHESEMHNDLSLLQEIPAEYVYFPTSQTVISTSTTSITGISETTMTSTITSISTVTTSTTPQSLDISLLILAGAIGFGLGVGAVILIILGRRFVVRKRL